MHHIKRLEAYAKQTNRKSFTPRQVRRITKKLNITIKRSN